jgi:polar amino acid transport system substrate-binding protein
VPTRVADFTRGHGADAIIILASGGGNQALELSAEVARERGRIVATGLVGLDIPRQRFYEKELDLVVSRGWGPGLYDPGYAERGVDYALPYARWTAGRNVDEFLALLGRGAVQVDHLITHRFPIERAVEAYDLISKGAEPYLGVLLTYAEGERQNGSHVVSFAAPSRRKSETSRVGLIGAGQFARGTLLPALRGMSGVELRGVATATPLTGRDVAARSGFQYATTDYKEVLADDAVDTVLIATRHGLHAQLVIESLEAGKHVFVEKPLALSREELAAIGAARRAAPNPVLMVGFNRRFSPFTVQLARWLADIDDPLMVQCRVNAGPVDAQSWVHDAAEGGGRILGELCHFVDLAQALCRSDPVRVQADTLQSPAYLASDNVAATLRFENGSLGSILYAATGDKSFSRERVEVFGGGAVGVIDNFRSVTFRSRGRERKMSRPGVDRGHSAELKTFFDAVRGGAASPVSFERYVATTLATFSLEEALRTGRSIAIDAQAVAV